MKFGKLNQSNELKNKYFTSDQKIPKKVSRDHHAEDTQNKDKTDIII